LIFEKNTRMKVRVKLWGTLRRLFPDYQHSQGMEVEIPSGSRARDLLAHLQISESQGALVSMENRILKADDVMPDGAQLSVLQAVGGG
jgi:sulfur carrier protein ThiS